MKSTDLLLLFDPSEYLEKYMAMYATYNWRKSEKNYKN